MLIYHGTSSRYLQNILKNGLHPRKKTKNSNWRTKSGSDRIYLSHAYAPYYAMNAIGNSEVDRPVILEIDTKDFNIMNLVADEDYLEQVTRNRDNLPNNWSITRRTIHYRQRARTMGFELENGSAFDSLKYLGTCAYLGDIPPSAITRVITWNPDKLSKLTWMVMDPTITLMNYKIVGKKYRWIQALLADREPDPKDAPNIIPAMGDFPEQMEYPYEFTKEEKQYITVDKRR
ncbi:hypothetical protein CL653_03265 [bacterium]|nr:hypothetical protein [bacterium]|tara:strand:+ start:3541 stop:4236 length:696 start_codon:yes stop_codon:yes gene_type:complete